MSLIRKTKTALDDSRMLMMGAQILLGFQFQAPFQEGFSALSPTERGFVLAVLALIISVVGLLIMPSSVHRIAHSGDASRSLIDLIDRITVGTLVLFAVAISIDLGLAALRIAGPAFGRLTSIIAVAATVAIWFGPCFFRKKEEDMATSDAKTLTAAKIDYVLTEARVVLPGAQAILGFQLAIVLMQAFADLPPGLKLIHGLALALIAIATTLLIAPASYHRIVYGGRDDPNFLRWASRLILMATVFLAFGISADAYVVAWKISGRGSTPSAFAAATAVVLFGLWHAWPWWKRWQLKRIGVAK